MPPFLFLREAAARERFSGIKRWEEAAGGVGGRNLIWVTFFGAGFTNKHWFSHKKLCFKQYGETIPLFYTFSNRYYLEKKKW